MEEVELNPLLLRGETGGKEGGEKRECSDNCLFFSLLFFSLLFYLNPLLPRAKLSKQRARSTVTVEEEEEEEERTKSNKIKPTSDCTRADDIALAAGPDTTDRR